MVVREAEHENEISTDDEPLLHLVSKNLLNLHK